MISCNEPGEAQWACQFNPDCGFYDICLQMAADGGEEDEQHPTPAGS